MKQTLINAKQLKEAKVKELKDKISKLDRKPQLVILSASDDKASENYIRNKMKIGAEIGVTVLVVKADERVTTEDMLETIHKLNLDADTDGIILQLPVYKHLDSERLIKAIAPCKDADCFSSLKLGEVIQGSSNVKPCTPNGVMNLLDFHNVDVNGKDVVVIGRSVHVGLSLSIMLTQKGATVTTCNSRTKDLESKIRQADVVISCVGKRNLIDPSWMKKDSVLIGVGITVDENFKQQTDYDVNAMLESSKCSMIGDRVNCTGTATVLSLIENVVELARI